MPKTHKYFVTYFEFYYKKYRLLYKLKKHILDIKIPKINLFYILIFFIYFYFL